VGIGQCQHGLGLTHYSGLRQAAGLHASHLNRQKSLAEIALGRWVRTVTIDSHFLYPADGGDLVPASAVTANACPLFYSWLLIE
jgi:hypothetical protein